MKKLMAIFILIIPMVAFAEVQRDTTGIPVDSVSVDTLAGHTSASEKNMVAKPDSINKLDEKESQVVFCRFKDTKQKYPVLTWGLLVTGAVLAGVTYYHHEEASNYYNEYLAATEDNDILRYKEAAQDNDSKAEKLSYVSAACLICAAVNYVIRTQKPSAKTNDLSGSRKEGGPALKQVINNGSYGLVLSWEVKP